MDLRPTGIEAIGDAPWGTHFCQFYGSKEDLADILVPYFVAGLTHDEFCMWVTSPPLGERDAWAALGRALPDLDSYRERGRIEILPHTDWYLLGGSFDKDRVLEGWVKKLEGALSRGCTGLRLSGNTFWLEKPDWRDFTDYEAAVDSVLGRYRMLALCTYSLDRCSAAEVADVIRNHQFALLKREGAWERIESFERKRLTEAHQRELALELDVARRAEAALRESEERYRLLFDNLSQGFAVHEMIYDDAGRPLDYRFLEINPAFESLTGLERERTVGRTAREVLPGLEQHWIDRYGEVTRTGTPAQFQSFAGDLGKHYEVLAFRPSPGRFATLFFDVTERKAAEARLRDSQADLNRAQAVAQIGSWRLDVRRNELFWSDQTYRMFGIPRDTPLTYETFLTAVHPEDREAVERAWTAAMRGEPYDIQHRIRVDETGRWVRERAELDFGPGGGLLGGLGLM